MPNKTWSNPDEFEEAAKKLAGLFVDNFQKYTEGVDDAVMAAGPKI